jgi:hypothetical protein
MPLMLPPKVRRSTTASQSRGSVNVLVHEENDSLEAIATLLLSSRSVRAWNSSSAPRRSSSM